MGLGSILQADYHKFLGGFYTFKSSQCSVSNLVHNKIAREMANVDSLLIRDEYKVKIYSDYVLSSNRFLFSIHDICNSNLQKIEDLTHRYLKRWFGIPQGGSWCFVHDSSGLGIKSISQLYRESRTLALEQIKFFGDSRVQHAFKSKETRESKWTRKSPSIMIASKYLNDAFPTTVPNNHVLDANLDGSHESLLSEEEAANHQPGAPSLNRNALRRGIQRQIQEENDKYWAEKISTYVMQGDLLSILKEEGSNITWKSFLWNLPRNVAKFALNASLNTLPSADNLKRWGKRTSDLCKICNGLGKQTLRHILSACPIALEQGRLTFRHDSVLSSIFDFIHPSLKPGWCGELCTGLARNKTRTNKSMFNFTFEKLSMKSIFSLTISINLPSHNQGFRISITLTFILFFGKQISKI